MSYRKFTRDVSIMAIVQLFYALEGMVILPIITKLMGAENYGVWTQLQVTITLAVPFFTLGLPYTLVRFLAGEKESQEIRDGIYSSIALVFTILILAAVALNIFSGPISSFYGQKSLFAQMLAAILVFTCLNELLFNIFRAFQQIGKYALFFAIQTIAEIGAISMALLLTHSLQNAIFSLLAVRMAVFATMAINIVKKIGISTPRFLKIKDYLAFGLPLIPGNFATWVVQSSNRYLIGLFLGNLYVGFYNSASMIGSSITLLIAPLGFVLPATLSKIYDNHQTEEIKKYLSYSLKYFLMLGIPSVLGLAALSRQILTIFSTAEIAQNSYYIVPLVAFSVLLSGIHAIVAQIIVLLKKTHVTSAIWITAALGNFTLNFMLIPKLGIIGAAITMIITYLMVLAATCCYTFNNFKLPIDWQFIIKSALASIMMAFLIIINKPDGLLQTAMAVALGALSYFGLMLAAKSFNKKELLFAKSFLAKKSF